MAIELELPPDAGGERLDVLLAEPLGSRSRAQRLIVAGQVLVDGVTVRKNHRVSGGEHVVVDEAPAAAEEPRAGAPAAAFGVAFEDEHLIVVDKPAGLVVHPSAGHATGTLVHALLGRARRQGEPLGSIAGVGRPGIVHRLDKDTSGLLVVAKTDAAQAALMRQFAEHTIEKEYVALVHGQAPAPRGRIEAPVGRHPADRQRMAVVAGGREAVTEYEVLDARGGHTLLLLRPLTGRTHQLRAHLAYLRLPIAGDRRYGGGQGPGGLARQFLHADRLRLATPRGERTLRAWSELPPDLAASLEAAGMSAEGLPVGLGAALEDDD